jgi:hypothetical protein
MDRYSVMGRQNDMELRTNLSSIHLIEEDIFYLISFKLEISIKVLGGSTHGHYQGYLQKSQQNGLSWLLCGRHSRKLHDCSPHQQVAMDSDV